MARPESPSTVFARTFAQGVADRAIRAMAADHVDRMLIVEGHESKCSCFGGVEDSRRRKAVADEWAQRMLVASKVHQFYLVRDGQDHQHNCHCFSPAKLTQISLFLG